MVRLTAALGIRRVRLVMVIERQHFVPLEIPPQHIVGVAIAPLRELVEEAEPVGQRGVVALAERQAEPRGQLEHRFPPLARRDDAADHCGDHQPGEQDEHQNWGGTHGPSF